MNFDENISFSNMLNSEYHAYEEFTSPALNIYSSQDHCVDESEEVTMISSQVFSSPTSKERRPQTKNFTK